MSINIKHSMFLLFALTSITACSNNKNSIKEKVITPTVITKKPVQKTIKEEPVYSSLTDQWSNKNLAPIIKSSPKKIRKAVATPPKVVKKKPISPKKRVVLKKKQIAHIAKRAKPKKITKKPVKLIKYANLKGDYVNNINTHKFINKMVSVHGFDRGYMNYLMSNANLTPFLKKMSYRDSIYKRKSNKNTKSRSGKWNRYRGNFLTERTISKGVEFWKQNRIALQRAELKYGVPQEYILGIIGVETRYGGNVGKNRAIDALAAMGFNNDRRGKYFTSELEAYLLMTRKEGLDPLKPMSSFAGALGLSQFMPSNIKRYAVDHDNSGSVNLWTPHDAIGSVANYFQKHGWKTGGTVAVPAVSSSKSYRNLKTGFRSKHSLTNLKSKGVSANYLGSISSNASLIKLNTYSGDELWLGGHNFYVITRYNHSSHYAMAVHQLAQEIDKRISGRSLIRQASIQSIMDQL